MPNSKFVIHLLIWVTILRLVGDHPWVGGGTLLGMVGDVDDNKVSSVQNFRSLGGVEAPNSYND